jgi:hypothetical protein
MEKKEKRKRTTFETCLPSVLMGSSLSWSLLFGGPIKIKHTIKIHYYYPLTSLE